MHIRRKQLHEMVDSEIREDLANPDNDGFLASPLHRIMLDELTYRQVKKLTEVIDSLSTSSGRYSKRLEYLTWSLVVFTIILVGLTIFLIKDAKEQIASQNSLTLSGQFFTPTNEGITGAIERGQPILQPKGKYTSDELDNYLGEYENIDSAYKEGLLSEDNLCVSFSYYADITMKNPEVQQYIVNARNSDPSFYIGFSEISGVMAKSKNPNCH